MTVPDGASLLQATANGIVAGSAFALVGVALGTILGVTRRFHVAFAVTYTLAAYVAAWLGNAFALPFWPALAGGAAAAALAGVAMEGLVYAPIARRAARDGGNLFIMTFVASLGLSIAGRNLIALAALASPAAALAGVTNARVSFGAVSTTSLDVTSVVTSWALVLALGAILGNTTFGRTVRAVRSNPRMSLCVGIDPRATFLAVFALASFLGGVAAVFAAAKTSATPEMGIVPLYSALVVAFLAGLSAPPAIVGLTGLVIGLTQSYASLVLPTQWTPLVTFGILFLVVALRPLGSRVPRPSVVPRAAVRQS